MLENHCDKAEGTLHSTNISTMNYPFRTIQLIMMIHSMLATCSGWKNVCFRETSIQVPLNDKREMIKIEQ